jgi:hypothetical protein
MNVFGSNSINFLRALLSILGPLTAAGLVFADGFIIKTLPPHNTHTYRDANPISNTAVRANIIKLIKIVRRAKNSRNHLQVVFSHWPIQVKICNAAQLMQAKAGLDNIQIPV